MSIGLLTPMPLRPILRISPSRYSALQSCALREIWASNRQAPLLPIPPAAHVGMIGHKLLELAFSRRIADEDTMQSYWASEVMEQEEKMKNNVLEKHLVPLSIHANNYRVKQVMIYNLVRPLFTKIVSQAVAIKKEETELWVQTKDGKVGGRIDLVKHTPEGVCIIDYKTGTITDSGSHGVTIKGAYQNQLKMYAFLYFISRGIWPSKLVLIGLNQCQYEVPFDKNECQSMINIATDYLDDLNSRIDVGLDPDVFAEPSPENCKFCSFRPACKNYWLKRESQSGWPTDFQGLITEKRLLGNGLFKVTLKSQKESVSIRSLTPERYLFLDNCNKAMFCNLGRDTGLGHYREIPMTTGYGL